MKSKIIGHFKKDDKYCLTLAFMESDICNLKIYDKEMKEKMCHNKIKCKGQNLSCGKFTPTIIEFLKERNFNKIFIFATKFFSAYSADNLERIKKKRNPKKKFSIKFLLLRQMTIHAKSILFKLNKEYFEGNRNILYPIYSGSCKVCKECVYDLLKNSEKECKAKMSMCRNKNKIQIAMESFGVDCNNIFSKMYSEGNEILWYRNNGLFPIYFSQVTGILFNSEKFKNNSFIRNKLNVENIKSFLLNDLCLKEIKESELITESNYYPTVNKKYFNLNIQK